MAARYRFRSDGVTYKVCNRFGENCIGRRRSAVVGSGAGALKAEGGGAASLESVGSVVASGFDLENGNQDLRLGGIVDK
jgi:hypothetical protein